MSQYQQPQPRPDLPYPGQPPAKKSRGTALVAIVASVVGALVGAGVTAAAMSGDPAAKAPAGVASQAGTTTPPDTGPSPDPIATPSTEYTPPEPTYGVPVKADFKLTVKVLTKKCFGSAGCNLTYRILVSYGGAELDPSVTYEVLYQVKGGEDGPVDNKLTVTGSQSSVDEEEFVSTKTSKTKLTAVVTDVLSGG